MAEPSKPSALFMALSRKPSAATPMPDEAPDDSEAGLDAACSDLMSAIRSDDRMALKSALKAVFTNLDSMPRDSADGEMDAEAPAAKPYARGGMAC